MLHIHHCICNYIYIYVLQTLYMQNMLIGPAFSAFGMLAGLMLLKGMQEKVRSSTALWSLARLAENSPENVTFAANLCGSFSCVYACQHGPRKSSTHMELEASISMNGCFNWTIPSLYSGDLWFHETSIYNSLTSQVDAWKPPLEAI